MLPPTDQSERELCRASTVVNDKRTVQFTCGLIPQLRRVVVPLWSHSTLPAPAIKLPLVLPCMHHGNTREIPPKALTTYWGELFLRG